jgi:hypothetical protein
MKNMRESDRIETYTVLKVARSNSLALSSPLMVLSSALVGFLPKDLRALPSSSIDTLPSLSLSKIWKHS